MRLGASLTFGGSGLDRAGHLRGDARALRRLWVEAAIVVLWRGKPLLASGGTALLRLASDHPVIRTAGPPLFLGLEERPVFAVEIPDWSGGVAPETGFLDTTVQRHPACPEAHGFSELRAVMTVLSARDAELAATAKAVLGWHRSHRFCAVCGEESAAAQGGWRRDCPACRGQHFPRTDPVVIMLITRGNRTLLGRSPGWPEGMFSCLAGFVEPGETMEAAVRREVFEEVGVEVGAVRYLSSQPWAFPSSLMLGCHGVAETEELAIDPVEIEEARWVTREDLARALAGEHPEIRPARAGAIARFLMVNWLADRLD